MSFRFFTRFVLLVFMGVLLYVTLVTHSRRSGSTGMDMGKVHLMREAS